MNIHTTLYDKHTLDSDVDCEKKIIFHHQMESLISLIELRESRVKNNNSN